MAFLSFLPISTPRSLYFYSTNVVLLLYKCTTVAMQKDYTWRAKGLVFYKMKHFASCDDCSFVQQSPQLIMYQQHIAARAKLKNFELKICLCVQQAVLSDEKCKYHNSQLSTFNSQLKKLLTPARCCRAVVRQAIWCCRPSWQDASGWR